MVAWSPNPILASISISVNQFKQRASQIAATNVQDAFSMGVQSGAKIVGRKVALSTARQAQMIDGILAEEMKYVAGWVDKIQENIKLAAAKEFAAAEEIQGALINAAASEGYRADSFAASLWSEAHVGLNAEMAQQADNILKETGERIMAEFTAYPESDVIETSCEGCADAADGNPYLAEYAPVPGSFSCLFNCRHYLAYQVISEEEAKELGLI